MPGMLLGAEVRLIGTRGKLEVICDLLSMK